MEAMAQRNSMDFPNFFQTSIEISWIFHMSLGIQLPKPVAFENPELCCHKKSPGKLRFSW